MNLRFRPSRQLQRGRWACSIGGYGAPSRRRLHGRCPVGRRSAITAFVAVFCLQLSACSRSVHEHSVYREIDRTRARQEMIKKLSSDINKVDHSIEVTKELIRHSQERPYLADLYFRLAELYVERSRYVYTRVMEQQPEGGESLGADKAIEVQISKRMAIETYTRIVNELPEYERNDQVRFFRAHEYRELGEWDTMIKEYEELITKFPKSDWAIEARLIIGDYYFDKGDFSNAETRYNDVLALPESHLHDMARYKIGWIRINQEKYPEALKIFEAAVTSERKRKKGAVGDAHRLDVKREALMAIPWPFSEIRKAATAPAYFLELSESKTLYLDALKRLANRYYAKSDFPNAALLYREVARLSADVELNTEFVQRIYDSVRSMPAKDVRRYSSAATDVQIIVDTVARFENHWNFSDEEKGQLKKDFELRARDLSTRLHAEAKKKNDVESARVAALAYRRYLSLFGDAPEHQAIQVNRAEALSQSKQLVDAGEQFEDVARALKDGPERVEFLYSAVFSFYQALDADSAERDKHPTGGGLLDLWEILRAREGLKQIGTYFVESLPNDKRTGRVKFNIAKMYYQQGDYERSTSLFNSFINEYPSHEDVGVAGHLALDGLNQLDKYEDIAKLAKTFVDNPQIKDAKFKTEAAQIGAAADKRKVEVAVMSDSGEDFSARMLNEWQKHKGSEEGEDFLYAGFLKLMSEGNVAGVFDFGGRLLGAYPNSKRVPDVLSTMGSFSMRIADFEHAAFLFEENYKRKPNEKENLAALATAANIYFLMGEIDKATETYTVLRSSRNQEHVDVATERLLQIYREAGSWDELTRVAESVISSNSRSIVGLFNLGLALAEQGRRDDARMYLGKAAEQQPRSDAEKVSHARAIFHLGRLTQQEYDSVGNDGETNLQSLVRRKMQLLQTAEKIYVQVIGSGDGELAIAALQEIARLYAGFGTFISNLPAPDGLSPEEQASYSSQVKSQVQGFANKGSDLLSKCVEKAQQLKIFSRHATACFDGSFESVVFDAKRRRPSKVGDEAYRGELIKIRNLLARSPESADLLKKLGRRAMREGDFYLSRLTLSKALEGRASDSESHNLLGVSLWSLGDPQSAFVEFGSAWGDRYAPAAANLAALYADYGYTGLSARLLGEAGNLKALDLSSSDYHPSVAKLLQEAGAR